MTKKELIAKVAVDAGLTKKQAGIAVASFLGGIKETLAKGETASLIGFGTFSIKNVPAGTCCGKPYPAKKAPKFKAGKGLKDAVL